MLYKKIIISLLVLLYAHTIAQAQINKEVHQIYVNTSREGDYTLQGAINEALEYQSTIIWVAPGEYILPSKEHLLVETNVYHTFKDISIISTHGASSTKIIGNGSSSLNSILTIKSCSSTGFSRFLLKGFTLENGQMPLDSHTGGGAIFCAAPGNCIFEDLILSNNSATYGGAIYVSQTFWGRTTLNNVLIHNNNSKVGGAICSFSESLILHNNTIANNHAEDLFSPGGIYHQLGNLSINNSILWNNSPYEIGVECDNLTINNSNVSAGKEGILANRGTIWWQHSISVSPDLTNDYTLSPSVSPCIDAGNNLLLPLGLLNDLASNTRINNHIVDMGAYESEAILQASFDISSVEVELHQTVYCNNTSAGNIDNYVWSIDGEEVNVLEHFDTYFTEIGTYNISLTVSNSTASSTADTLISVLALPCDLFAGVVNSNKISDNTANFSNVLSVKDEFGISVSYAGDIDGDGISDLLAGADNDNDGGNNRGAFYVLFLNKDGSVKSYQKISSTSGNFPLPLSNNDNFGTSLCYLGDITGDGNNEIAVGAFGDDDGGQNCGAIYILSLNNNGMVVACNKINNSSLGNSLYANDFFGKSISTIGDLNQDGITDLAVGASSCNDGGSKRGAIFILLMNSDLSIKSYQKISSTTGNFYGSLGNGDKFGCSSCPVGDMDGDGIIDLAVGAYNDDDGGSNKGAVWLLYMQLDGTVKDYSKISSTEGNFMGELFANDKFGRSLTNIGDIDNNGISDLAVGAYGSNNSQGAVWIVLLNKDFTVMASQKISSESGNFNEILDDGDKFSRSIAYLGDRNNDGTSEIVIGAYKDDDGGENKGAIYTINLCSNGYQSVDMLVYNSTNHNSNSTVETKSTTTETTSLSIIEESIEFYPNPFTSNINLTVNTQQTVNLNIEIVNMLGVVVSKYDTYSSNETILIGKDLQAGIYLININYNNVYKQIKIVKHNGN